jgi:hypothetical protein
MQKQYLGIGVLVLAVIVAGWYFVGSKEPAEPVVTPTPATTPTTTPTTTSATTTVSNTTQNTHVIDLIEADIASDKERTLEITGWKKLSDEPHLNFSEQYGLEIWIPEGLFTNGSYDSGRGSSIPLYRWPDNLEKTGENLDLLRPYLLDLIVGRIEYKNNFSGTSSVNPNYVLDDHPVEINDSHSIKFNQPQKLESEVVVEISITIQKEYTNSSDIFNEILERLVIK